MTDLTIFTAGSQGDVQPCALLGSALQRAGYAVRLAAPENFASYLQGRGLEFHPLRGDVQAIMAGETGRRFMEKGGANPVQAMLAMRKMIAPVALQMAEDALQACRGAGALISLAVFAPFGKSIAEICDIPLICVEPTPLLPTRAFAAPGWPWQGNLGGRLNRFSGAAMLRLIWGWYSEPVNEFRRRYRLPPLGGGDFQPILAASPLLGAYSPSVIPAPPDWPATVYITGYWFEEQAPEWRPPRELQDFLEAGEAPVYVGFGSMGGQNPQTIAEAVVKALQICGRRGLLLTGWGGLQALEVPASVLVIESAPHAWLFPRMAALVHHGGAGTTAEGLRAGKTTVIVPFIVDQPFWGARVRALGVGPPPIPARKLTAEKLAEAIQRATGEAQMKERAAVLGAAICAEDGVGTAVNIIRQVVGG